MRPNTALVLAGILSIAVAIPARGDIIVNNSNRDAYAADDFNSDSNSTNAKTGPFVFSTSGVDNAFASQNSNNGAMSLGGTGLAAFVDSLFYGDAYSSYTVAFTLSAPHAYTFSGSVFSDIPADEEFELGTFSRIQFFNLSTGDVITPLVNNGSVAQSGILPAGAYSLAAIATAFSQGEGDFDTFGFGPLQGQNTADFRFQLNLTAVPEPTSLGIVGMLGLCGWAARRRRRA